jgi:hypothetical protein
MGDTQGKQEILAYFDTLKGKSRRDIILDTMFKFPRFQKSTINRYYDMWNQENRTEENNISGEVENEMAKDNDFELISKTIVLKGKNGTYTIDDKGVSLKTEKQELAFGSIEQLRTWANEFEKAFGYKAV